MKPKIRVMLCDDIGERFFGEGPCRHAVQGGYSQQQKAVRHGAHPVFAWGQRRVKAADHRYFSAHTFSNFHTVRRVRCCGNFLCPGAKQWHQRTQQGGFSRTAPAGQQQVALTAHPERTYNRARGQSVHRHHGKPHTFP